MSTTAYTYYGPSSFTVTVKVDPNATVGGSIITITNPDGGYCTQSNYFSVAHSPDVDHISPSLISAGVSFTTITVVGKGAYFESGFQFWFSTAATGEKDTLISTGNLVATSYPTAVFTSTGIGLTNRTAINDYIVVQNPDGGKAFLLLQFCR